MRFFLRLLRALFFIALSPLLLIIAPFLLAWLGARLLGGSDPDGREAERVLGFRIF